MSEPIKPKEVFHTEPHKPINMSLSARQTFSAKEAEHFQPVELNQVDFESEQVESLVSDVFKPRRSLWRKLVLTGVALFLTSTIVQMFSWINQAWQSQNWIELGMVVAGVFIISAGIGAFYSEWRHLYSLRQRAEERDIGKELLTSHGRDKGKAFCEKITRQSGLREDHPALLRWQSMIHETHNDREIIELYAKLVQPVLDKQARYYISRYSAESAIMIAVSPLALVDMAFIAWRNIKLISQIAKVYGIQLGYFSRLRLFRLVLINIAFAGATELIKEVGLDWMSQDLAARLSTRAAQGIGAGLLTARLGIKAMELCRPLPWLEDDKPKLGDFRQELLSQVKQIISKPDPGKN